MTVQEMLDELAERLVIMVADDELSDDDYGLLLGIIERVDKEVAEHGYVTSNLTSEQLAMPWDDFIEEIRQRGSQQ
jgi:hypothetical protein